jgi:polysaccharide export outer membrane protein
MLLLGWSISPVYSQEKYETPAQTNERIQHLAAVAAKSHPSDLPIGTGDLLHIDVFDVPDLSRDVRVNETGFISLPLIPGKIEVGGLTAFQAEEKIEDLLQVNGLVTHPQVSVFVKEQNSQPISVIGSVSKPMVYQVIRPTTLLELLSQAGGIANDAGNVVIITRQVRSADAGENAASGSDPNAATKTQTITINLRDLLESGDAAFNIPVYGGDVVTVPKAGIVYVAGAVQQPGGYVLQSPGEDMTTLKAVALAHGLLTTAKKTQAVIIRSDPATGQKKEINIDLNKIMARKSEDARLYANDILFVPDSTGKRALYRAGEAALSVTTGLAIIRAGR